MYFPSLRIQLTGIATESVDCGVRATQMGLDWLTKGKWVPSVKTIRRVMSDQDATNYADWDKAIDILGGRRFGFAGEKTNDFEDAWEHVEAGNAVIWAIDYQQARKVMPRKVGSLTFNGYHAVLSVGKRKVRNRVQTRWFDSLFDGRYRGCPKSPLWVDRAKVKNISRKVGREVAGSGIVYALKLHRDADLGGIGFPGEEVGEYDSLIDILSDLRDVNATLDDRRLDDLEDRLSSVMGLSDNPEANAATLVESGIILPAA